ncbi:MAG: hypothetical protein ACKOES_15415 [Planctomycetaceae bacterium]
MSVVASTPSLPTAGSIEPVRRMLAAVRRRARLWIWVESLAWLALVAAAAFWLTLLFDWWVEPPVAVRLTALALTACAIAWIVALKLLARLRAPLSDASLALVVERHDARFGDSISTAISLADRPPDAGDTGAPCDPDLAARTTAAAAALAGSVRLGGLFRGRRLAALAVAAVASLATIGALAATRGDVTGLWLRRMTRLSDEPWPRRVRLAIEGFEDGRRLVARGSDVEIVVRVRADGPLPDLVELRTRSPDGWQSRRMGTLGGVGPDGQTFVHTLTGVGGDLEFEVRGGDGRLTGLRLLVAEAPALAGLTIEYEPPAYLGTGFRPTAASRVVRVPRGSRVRITCTSTKPLAEAVLTARDAAVAGTAGAMVADPEALAGDVAPESSAPSRVLASLGATETAPDSGDRLTLEGEIPALDGDVAVSLDLRDTDGLSNRQPIQFLVIPVLDEPPQVAMTPRGMPAAITGAGRLLLVGTIGDDHALAEAAVQLRREAAKGTDGIESDGPPGDRDRSADDTVRLPIPGVREGALVAEFTTDSPHEVVLAPLALTPGERLACTVTARDRCTLDGAAQEGRGETWSLEVVTPEALRALLEAREILLRRRFESAIDDLSHARERLASPTSAVPDEDAFVVDPVVACAETAARTAGEAADVAEAFRTIHLELATNDLLTPEVEERLIRQIAAPLAAVASRDLPDLERACRDATPSAVVQRADVALERLRAILARMIELESYNQLVERLRDVIRLQEQIRAETLEEQKRRGRALLQRP